MAGVVRSRGVTCGRLVLFAALLFGVLTMHTVGHPAEHSGPGAASFSTPLLTGPSYAAPAGPSSTAPAGRSYAVVAGEHTAAGARKPATAPPHRSPALHTASGHGPGDDAPMSGMDPLSVCLAVLGAWGLALLGARLLRGRRAAGPSTGAPVDAGLPPARRPDPPPPIPVLAAVSVLRR
ncbi:hypothetical protein [Streptomyces sp. V2I9]|uniref:hypothetical protein n=1 Tax=Streptomyces sp. V2I9 TaxID=3042304 RepID=UPI002782055E|nr:hypothetical protein [Streptomyces sp. V2I9]MDQ0984132.1 hypothetical protein [Streptomyces sp. V2I9]